MNKFIEGLRTSLEEATANMDEFLMSVTSMVTLNADTVLKKYESTELPLSTALTNPWEAAKKASNTYSGNALDLMNQWTREGGFFAQFNSVGTSNLTSPWSAGQTAASNFASSVQSSMSSVYTSIQSNVRDSVTQLNQLKAKYQEIIDTAARAANAGSGGISGPTYTPPASTKTYTSTAYLQIGYDVYSATSTATTESAAKNAAAAAVVQKAYNAYKALGYDDSYLDKRYATWKKNVQFTKPTINTSGQYATLPTSLANDRQYAKYAKGTLGTKRDQWAITDEPQFGDELVLVPGKDGNLSFMRKGTTVVPADITKNLVEWGQFTPDSMNLGGGVNVNMINNAVNKPEFNFTFDALVKAETITEETLPAVKKLVTQELNRFTKELNYALKGKGAR